MGEWQGKSLKEVARLKEWKALLGRQAPIGRQIVTKLLDGSRLVFAPRADRAYEFTGTASFGKLLRGIVLPQVLALM